MVKISKESKEVKEANKKKRKARRIKVDDIPNQIKRWGPNRTLEQFRSMITQDLNEANLEQAVDDFHEALGKNVIFERELVSELLKRLLMAGYIQGGAITVIDLLKEYDYPLSIKHLCSALSALSQRASIIDVKKFLDEIDKVVDFGVDADDEHIPRCRYAQHFLRLLVIEFLEEAGQCLERLNQMRPSWLEDQGLTVCELRVQPSSGTQVKLVSERKGLHNSAAPSAVMKGDSVLLTADDPSAIRCPSELEAEVVQILPFLCVKIMGAPANFSSKEMMGTTWRLDKMANRVTFSRQLEGLRALTDRPTNTRAQTTKAVPETCNAILSAGNGVGVKWKRSPKCRLLCESSPPNLNQAKVDKVLHQIEQMQDLNHSQKAAIQAAVQRRLTLIHGPPGTGKTHTAVSIVQAWLECGQGPVLCTSDSNTAVDNLVSGLASAGVKVVRIGRPESVRGDLNKFTLDATTADLPSDTPKNVIYKRHQDEIRKAQAVCATCSGSGSEILERMVFPSVLLDEASQATEPSCIVPIMHGAQQVTLVGDHKQLPPTILSREAQNGGLAISLFDRLVHSDVPAQLLDTQYRMHPALMWYPSQTYYDGAVKSGVQSAMREPVKGFKWPVLGVPAAFVPVENGVETQEGTSNTNQREADKLHQVCQMLLQHNQDLTPSDIGVITPYSAQVRLLRRLLAQFRNPSTKNDNGDIKDSPEVGLEINSVDGFQGREKEVILVSTVRANKQGEVGFLSDVRRMNVTLTRARRGLIMFGHTPTLRNDQKCWNPWLMWAYSCGLVVGTPAIDPSASSALSKVDAEFPVHGVCSKPPKLQGETEEELNSWTCPEPCASIMELDEEFCLSCGKPKPEDIGTEPRREEWEDHHDEEERASDIASADNWEKEDEELAVVNRISPPCEWKNDQVSQGPSAWQNKKDKEKDNSPSPTPLPKCGPFTPYSVISTSPPVIETEEEEEGSGDEGETASSHGSDEIVPPSQMDTAPYDVDPNYMHPTLPPSQLTGNPITIPLPIQPLPTVQSPLQMQQAPLPPQQQMPPTAQAPSPQPQDQPPAPISSTLPTAAEPWRPRGKGGSGRPTPPIPSQQQPQRVDSERTQSPVDAASPMSQEDWEAEDKPSEVKEVKEKVVVHRNPSPIDKGGWEDEELSDLEEQAPPPSAGNGRVEGGNGKGAGKKGGKGRAPQQGYSSRSRKWNGKEEEARNDTRSDRPPRREWEGSDDRRGQRKERERDPRRERPTGSSYEYNAYDDGRYGRRQDKYYDDRYEDRYDDRYEDRYDRRPARREWDEREDDRAPRRDEGRPYESKEARGGGGGGKGGSKRRPGGKG
eukprot:Sspe_Gene.7228::Locus_2447_Transcript_1_1_Confidence_1.000_Length_4022::g.7228::m.7228/K14326/UPF1, RENT1; regulator of nonsense transcripts 1